MSTKLVTITRPSNEDGERDVIYTIEHRCGAADMHYEIDGDAKALGIDALLYPVGIYGSSMPMGIPFQVSPSEPCGACGLLPTIWFQWKKTLIFDLGSNK